ncbi:hypothetical protein [Eisenibacter elegans]|jgi:hypothetical protein|uniref:hypothetical protein n=1 Tax=Eisenibacter elegans TaxID=997 RepID=UPI00047A5100|nr:hypothetical protein [Eisenibacter elegans]
MRHKLVQTGFLALLFTTLYNLPTQAQILNKILPTTLQVTVLDDKGKILPNTIVYLYENETDYENKKATITPQVANKRGRVEFSGLESKIYFIRAENGALNNSQGVFQTPPLTEAKQNQINIIVKQEEDSFPGF